MTLYVLITLGALAWILALSAWLTASTRWLCRHLMEGRGAPPAPEPANAAPPEAADKTRAWWGEATASRFVPFVLFVTFVV